ncbi:alpha-ribazole phosphatase [Ancylomarina euxinus]|uniref:Alpha-ribazole phosphatase n=1 Tax=Ancylomarina euxinus TaxID=2283627 RepID=A0A425Y3X6_9BACT|nr:alpha-ribazole phosphatase [Ancylomarina euxinus]MCZ4694504.1 alpha-ribazole phosphatase [Ancylomarina euxinus]MUP14047.1 alpha-ribazole phosphatase [Ancylomarina euxinus]RRG22907.1 alpha-ribazole phosphatase [Ancylomarina euxinus]
MILHLIRHTKVNVEPGICYGQKDVELLETYPEELELVRNNIADLKFDAYYSSPLTRAKTLATDLFGDVVVFDDRLMELNFGDWEGKAWDEIKDPFLDTWMEDFVNKKCSNGESFVMLHKRVLQFLGELKSLEHNHIAIVTHGGVIRTLQAIHKNIELKEAFNEAPAGFGELVQLEF